ncbi:MAG TPA: zinc ABC transporter substrate-binding protein [Syntrophomonadaceae bacterium]|nr:zinc ABC transporter substrate-binding protein [Syntrophomonadaceae bacterium]
MKIYSRLRKTKCQYQRVGLMVILLLAGLLAGCQQQPVSAPTGADDRLKVAVTIMPQATFVKEIGGELVEVVTMVPPGGNPENYSPTPQQMIQFSDADIYFAIGVPAEEAILPQLKSLVPGMKMVDLPAMVDRKYPPVTFPSGERDPHMWLSPQRVQEIVRVTTEQLTLLDPLHGDIYAANSAAYIERLGQLDNDIRSALTDLPNRTIIVYHPAFGYFAADYGLTMIALEEEGKEAAAVDLQRVIDLARAQNIKVVFYQAEIDSKQSRTLAEEIGGQAEMIAPLDPDYIGNLHKTALTFRRVLQQAQGE